MATRDGISLEEIKALAAAAVQPGNVTRSEIGALAFEHQLTSNPLVLWEMYACARAAGVELPSEVVRYFDKVAARLRSDNPNGGSTSSLSPCRCFSDRRVAANPWRAHRSRGAWHSRSLSAATMNSCACSPAMRDSSRYR